MGATAAIGIMSVASAYGQSEATKMQGQYQKTMADINARNANLQAEDAIKRGDKASSDYKKKVNQTVGSQKAAFAAQGIDISSGSAQDIVAETYNIGNLDAITIKNNAYREAMGYRSQAFNYGTEGKFAELSANTNARNTLIAGGLQAAGYAYGASGTGTKKGG